MGKIVALAFAALVAFSVAAPAEARDGCGSGWHRNHHGRCVRNDRGPHVGVTVAVPGIGVFVTGRGYWDGHRYWKHRHRRHGHWRYY